MALKAGERLVAARRRLRALVAARATRVGLRGGVFLGKVLFCVVFALVGAAFALHAGGPVRHTTVLGEVEAQAYPSRHGVVDAYVPLLDWGLRARPYRAPVTVNLRLGAVDRERLVDSFRSSDDVTRQITAIERDLNDVFRAELKRASLLALAGGLAGGLFAGALLAAFSRRRWLLVGAALGLTATAAAAGLCVLDIARLDPERFREPTFYAHGDELAEILVFAAQIEETTASYTDSYAQAVASLTRLLAAPTRPIGERAPAADHTFVLASDLHANTFVLPALGDYVHEQPVFFVGDFTELGTRLEDSVVPAIKALDAKVYAVSGNHDSTPLMRRLAATGVVVLTRTGVLQADGTVAGGPVIDVKGLTVAGYDDPLESPDADLAAHDLELKGDDLVRAQADFLTWFAALPERPDVVLVHQNAIGQALLRTFPEVGAPAAEPAASLEPPLVILVGHDHRQHIDRRQGATLVDGGTVGAGGPFGVGSQYAGFALLHFNGRSLRSVDLIKAEPLSGDAAAEHVVIARAAEDVKRKKTVAAILGHD